MKRNERPGNGSSDLRHRLLGHYCCCLELMGFAGNRLYVDCLHRHLGGWEVTYDHDTDEDREYAATFINLDSWTQYLIIRQLDLVRNEALEEAARVADHRADIWRKSDGQCAFSLEEECEDIAAAIRVLKKGKTDHG